MITGKEVEYRKDICFGNVCKRCMQVHNATKLVGEELRAHIKKSLVRPISLQQHCSNESGFPLGSRELNEYISRYYVDNGL